jgi:protein required for attachment to host cells
MNLTGRIHDDLKGFSTRPPVRPYKVPRTWVMVVDLHIARLFERHERSLEPIGTAIPDPTENAELRNKTVGRNFSSANGSIHHKYEPHMNESREQSLVFARQISVWLDQAVRADAFDRLVLIAAPRILGDLRKMVSQPVHERIFAEINKDLTKSDLRIIEEELERTVFF